MEEKVIRRVKPGETSSLTYVSYPRPDDDYTELEERPVVTNLARQSVLQYHLSPSFPSTSTFSSVEELDRISNTSPGSSSALPSTNSSPIPFSSDHPSATTDIQAPARTFSHASNNKEDDERAPTTTTTAIANPRIIIVSPRGEPLYPRQSEEEGCSSSLQQQQTGIIPGKQHHEQEPNFCTSTRQGMIERTS
jgi:hypothetical protein